MARPPGALTETVAILRAPQAPVDDYGVAAGDPRPVACARAAVTCLKTSGEDAARQPGQRETYDIVFRRMVDARAGDTLLWRGLRLDARAAPAPARGDLYRRVVAEHSGAREDLRRSQ